MTLPKEPYARAIRFYSAQLYVSGNPPGASDVQAAWDSAMNAAYTDLDDVHLVATHFLDKGNNAYIVTVGVEGELKS